MEIRLIDIKNLRLTGKSTFAHVRAFRVAPASHR